MFEAGTISVAPLCPFQVQDTLTFKVVKHKHPWNKQLMHTTNEKDQAGLWPHVCTALRTLGSRRRDSSHQVENRKTVHSWASKAPWTFVWHVITCLVNFLKVARGQFTTLQDYCITVIMVCVRLLCNVTATANQVFKYPDLYLNFQVPSQSISYDWGRDFSLLLLVWSAAFQPLELGSLCLIADWRNRGIIPKHVICRFWLRIALRRFRQFLPVAIQSFLRFRKGCILPIVGPVPSILRGHLGHVSHGHFKGYARLPRPASRPGWVRVKIPMLYCHPNRLQRMKHWSLTITAVLQRHAGARVCMIARQSPQACVAASFGHHAQHRSFKRMRSQELHWNGRIQVPQQLSHPWSGLCCFEG